MPKNVGFFAGGEKFETWKDWSLPTATYFLPAGSGDYTVHPTLNGVPISDGMLYWNTTSDVFRIYNNGTWQDFSAGGIGGDQTIVDLWQFDQMPTVGPNSYQILPLGGTTGQILSKISGNDWESGWIDPPAGAFDPSFNYNITGSWTFSATQRLVNAIALVALDFAGGLDIDLVQLGTDDVIRVGDRNSSGLRFESGSGGGFMDVDTINVASWTSFLFGSLLIKDRINRTLKAGFRNPASRDINVSQTVSQDDESAWITMVGGNGQTLTFASLEEGTIVHIRNISANPWALVSGGGETLNWLSGAGYIQGGRMLAAGSAIEAIWRTTTEIEVVGNGLT